MNTYVVLYYYNGTTTLLAGEMTGDVHKLDGRKNKQGLLQQAKMYASCIGDVAGFRVERGTSPHDLQPITPMQYL